MLNVVQLKERLNQQEKVIQKSVNKYLNRDLYAFLFCISVFFAFFLDLFGGWVADFIYPKQDYFYWELYFVFDSAKMLFVSLASFSAISVVISKRNYLKYFKWLTQSWFGFCSADFIDVITGNRSEFTQLDLIAIIFCLISFLFTILKQLVEN